jgi:hypothetical protein
LKKQCFYVTIDSRSTCISGGIYRTLVETPGFSQLGERYKKEVAVDLSRLKTTCPIPLFYSTHCKKKRLAIFPSPGGMSLTKISLASNNLIIPAVRESLVSDIPAGDGKIAILL